MLFTRMGNRLAQSGPGRSARRALSSFGGSGGGPRAIFANYRVYKGSGSMSLSALPPRFKKLSRMDEDGYALALDKAGVILLEFVPSAGDRVFQYDKKKAFALSAMECGEIVANASARQKCQFVHDPTASGFGSGGRRGGEPSQTMKRLVVDPAVG